MRTLAKDLRISMITTKRAYEELERDGFIESFTGRGSFVKAQNEELLREQILSETEEIFSKGIKKGRDAGLTPDELLEIFQMLLSE